MTEYLRTDRCFTQEVKLSSMVVSVKHLQIRANQLRFNGQAFVLVTTACYTTDSQGWRTEMLVQLPTTKYRKLQEKESFSSNFPK